MAGPEVTRMPDAHLVGNDARERRLAEARRAIEQDVVERLVSSARRFYVDRKIALCLLLSGIVRPAASDAG